MRPCGSRPRACSAASQTGGDLQSRRRRRRARRGRDAAGRAAGARGDQRSHQADDRVRRDARAHASSAPERLDESQRGSIWAPKLRAAAACASASWGSACSAATPPRCWRGSGSTSRVGAARAKRCQASRAMRAEPQLDAFLARTDMLVCLLPLTPDTRGILNRRTFEKLARNGKLGGPIIINAGRGGLQVEDDILGRARRRHVPPHARRVRHGAAAAGQPVLDPSEGHALAAQCRRHRSRMRSRSMWRSRSRRSSAARSW